MPASSAERLYAVPVISEVIAAARTRPPSESYAWPVAMSSAPRFAYPMPSWRKARVVTPIFLVGKSAKQIEMSIAVMTYSTLLTNFSTSKPPSALRNFIRFSEARLQDGIGALPRRLGDVAEQLPRVDGLDDLAVQPAAQVERGALLECPHEFVA